MDDGTDHAAKAALAKMGITASPSALAGHRSAPEGPSQAENAIGVWLAGHCLATGPVLNRELSQDLIRHLAGYGLTIRRG